MADTLILTGRAAFISRLIAAKKQALNEMGELVVERARAKAPVRKPYKENKRQRTRQAGPELIAAAVKRIKENKKLDANKKAAALYLLEKHPESARVAIRRKNSINRRSKPLLIGRYKTATLKKIKPGTGQESTSVTSFHGSRGSTEHAADRYAIRDDKGRITAFTKAQYGYALGSNDDSRLTARARHEIKSGYGLTNEEGQPTKRREKSAKVFYGGRLKNSILAGGPESTGTRMYIEIGTDVHYAIFVEFPTRHNAAQPFLLPGLKDSKRAFIPILINAMHENGISAHQG